MTIWRSTTAINLGERRFDKIVASVGLSVKEIIDATPIAVLQYELQDDREVIESFLAVQIQLLTESVNVQQNIQPYQIPSIAKTLIDLFPVESLEDFVLCFKRGALALYGPIYNRLDASILVEWMQKHLDEKYMLIEAKVTQEQAKHTNDNQVNYEAFKARAPEVFAKAQNKNNAMDMGYERYKLENPYRYYTVEGVEVYARSQELAERQVEALIQSGELERVHHDKKADH